MGNNAKISDRAGSRRPKPRRYGLMLACAAAFLAVGLYFSGWSTSIAIALSGAYDTLVPPTVSFDRADPDPESEPLLPPKPVVEHAPTPKEVKAVYMTQCYGGTPSLRSGLIKLVNNTELNSIVLDLKDYSGTVSFPSKVALEGGGCTISDFRDLIKQMHDNNIYVIGRLTVFQDPVYTKAHPEEAVQSVSRNGPWKDRKGLSFVDVGSSAFHSYIIALAREGHDLGVDEINFDYVRYPSDGDMKDAEYAHSEGSHPEMLEKFFKKLSEAVRADQPDHMPVLSADLFGMTTTNTDDLNIGQVLERTLPYFDYIAPMVYPSHYPTGFHGYKNVNANSYGIVHFSMSESVRRTVASTTPVEALAYERMGTSTPAVYKKPVYDKQKMRPWLQDFDYPVAYTPAMVQEQIKATHDSGLNSWMFWDPANRYDSLRQVLSQ
ncbi:MAG: hypothetical protein G01um10148_275 [Parcubacteria group bacterium Gr01-1014_8]|nr:MAG: hypothetical protein G01um10148_275 [Parcubacteria group bacterium Gr01-1014_8]